MRENRQVELKERVTNTFLKTVSAYANYGTGEILFGVADDGTMVGLEDPTSDRLRIENAINDGISPRPEFSISENSRTGVVTLRVLEGDDKPYLYVRRHTNAAMPRRSRSMTSSSGGWCWRGPT